MRAVGPIGAAVTIAAIAATIEAVRVEVLEEEVVVVVAEEEAAVAETHRPLASPRTCNRRPICPDRTRTANDRCEARSTSIRRRRGTACCGTGRQAQAMAARSVAAKTIDRPAVAHRRRRRRRTPYTRIGIHRNSPIGTKIIVPAQPMATETDRYRLTRWTARNATITTARWITK
uniref:Uncharacterized protein n=1 Tax=Anopheles merus TaxID=30066 RepID=A0A182VNG1_ANOME